MNPLYIFPPLGNPSREEVSSLIHSFLASRFWAPARNILESILTSIKKMLGITEEYAHFDTDIIIHINTAFMILTQLGVGPPEGFVIEDETSSWNDFIKDSTKIEAVKTYIYLKVRLVFDPPSSSAVIEAMERSAKEYEWRLNAAVETT